MGALELTQDQGWAEPKSDAAYKLCGNYTNHAVCNWAMPAAEDDPFCVSCRLNRVIPDLSLPGNRDAWAKVELAKRRTIYSLLALGLPVLPKTQDPNGGLAFEFLADDPVSGRPVMTGHDEGVIVLNVIEADDSEREKRRNQLNEPYRTLLGHFRHEVGHYFWDRLVQGRPALMEFRRLFGDETISYQDAMRRYYAQGAPLNWRDRFISAYATMHPWEDWAECWAHYLHMTDTLETASACGLSLTPQRKDEPSLATSKARRSFDELVADWFPLTHVLNNLNRGLGLPDGYPFVLPPTAVEKLRFIHELIGAARESTATPDATAAAKA
jgi:hypothetical protein